MISVYTFLVFALVLCAFICGSILIYLINLKDTFEVHSSQVYDEDIETVFNKLCDFTTWKDWSPWLLHEPDCHLVFSENSSLQNGFYTWDGQLIGNGKLTHTQLEKPTAIKQQLEIIKPYKSTSDVEFKLTHNAGKTQVEWIMKSKMPFFLRFMIPKIKNMITQDYKLGLALLAGALDQHAEHPNIQFHGEVFLEPQHFLCKAFSAYLDTIENTMAQGFSEMLDHIQKNNLTIVDKPRTFYHKINTKKMHFIGDMAIPIKEDIHSDIYSIKSLGKGKYYQVDVLGDYRFLESAWHATMSRIYMTKLKIDPSRSYIEVYLNDPHEVEHTNQLKTRIFVPIK